jgi:hypothetical protein
MAVELSVLDQLQTTYKAAVEHWVSTIRQEEALASSEHSEAEIDQWEEAGDREQEAGSEARQAKKRYEDALREKFFNF